MVEVVLRAISVGILVILLGIVTGAIILVVVVVVSIAVGLVISRGIACAVRMSVVVVAVVQADRASGVADLDTWRGIAPPRRVSAVEPVVVVVLSVGRLVIWLGIAVLKVAVGDLVVVTVVVAVVEKARALIVGSQGILRGSVLKLLGESEGLLERGGLRFAKGEKGGIVHILFFSPFNSYY